MSDQLKSTAKELVDNLPEEAKWDDLMYDIYVHQSIEKGLSDAKEVKVISHVKLKRKYSIA